MDYFHYHEGRLFAEDTSITDIVKHWGTPCYVYSKKTFTENWRAFDKALVNHPHLVAYSVKANSNLTILNILAQLGSGFDVVSLGELERVLVAGGDPNKIIFSGVGKTAAEMQRALEVGISCFNVESFPELERLNEIAGTMKKIAPVSLRINPNISVKTHPYIATGLKENKFGIDYDQALKAYTTAAKLPHLKIVGIDCHIGSQITDLQPFLDAAERILILMEQIKKHDIKIEHINLGGGLGIKYHEETPPQPADYADALGKLITDKKLKVIVEPGRSIIANAGILVTKVEYLKLMDHKNFAVVDAGMNDLIRPALYEAWHKIIPVKYHTSNSKATYDVVGPVCETSDFLGKNRELSIMPGDLLAILSAGAYGSIMSSNYNSRPKAAEVLVDGEQVNLIRRRETIEELFAAEKNL